MIARLIPLFLAQNARDLVLDGNDFFGRGRHEYFVDVVLLNDFKHNQQCVAFYFLICCSPILHIIVAMTTKST